MGKLNFSQEEENQGCLATVWEAGQLSIHPLIALQTKALWLQIQNWSIKNGKVQSGESRMPGNSWSMSFANVFVSRGITKHSEGASENSQRALRRSIWPELKQTLESASLHFLSSIKSQKYMDYEWAYFAAQHNYLPLKYFFTTLHQHLDKDIGLIISKLCSHHLNIDIVRSSSQNCVLIITIVDTE